MGEAMIIRAGGGYNSNGSSGEDKNIIGWQTKTEIFTTNGYFTVPKAKDQEFHVRLFGGGGGASYVLAGGMNWSTYAGGGGGNMNNNTFILNQLESVQISIGSGGGNAPYEANGGSGGITAFGKYISATGGGGAGCFRAMAGDIYGGHGGTGGGTAYYKNNVTGGGNGIYGGGGGSTTAYRDYNNVYSNSGLGGIYGGNGYGGGGVIKDGTNTMGNVELEFTGPGNKGGGYYYIGGGGYGGCGGSMYGGGGGYGANGGNGTGSDNALACGGGGGYGGKGGDGRLVNGSLYGGYGGGYGPENYGRGGGSDPSTMNGKSGCIIITYQAPIYKNAT